MIPDPPSDLTESLTSSELPTVLDWWHLLDDSSRTSLLAFDTPFFPETTVAFPPPATPTDDTEIDDYHEYLINHEHKARGPFMSDPPGTKLVIAVPLWSPYWPPYPDSFRFRAWRRGGDLT
jgi:hypothetical protein